VIINCTGVIEASGSANSTSVALNTQHSRQLITTHTNAINGHHNNQWSQQRSTQGHWMNDLSQRQASVLACGPCSGNSESATESTARKGRKPINVLNSPQTINYAWPVVSEGCSFSQFRQNCAAVLGH
jgi:hypothetical protein